MPNTTHRVVKWALIGFAIPVSCLGVLTVAMLLGPDRHPIDRQRVFAALPYTMLPPGLGCAFVFGLAGYASAVEYPRCDFVRSLMIISILVTIAALVVYPSPYDKMPRYDLGITWIKMTIPLSVGLMACGVLAVINRYGARAA